MSLTPVPDQSELKSKSELLLMHPLIQSNPYLAKPRRLHISDFSTSGSFEIVYLYAHFLGLNSNNASFVDLAKPLFRSSVNECSRDRIGLIEFSQFLSFFQLRIPKLAESR